MFLNLKKYNKNKKYRLFCFPHAGGNRLTFEKWITDINSDIEVIPISLDERNPNDSFRDIANCISNEIYECLDERKFLFYGHSMGAALAFLVAYLCQNKFNKTPEKLIIAGRQSPQDKHNEKFHSSMGFEALLETLRENGGTPEELLNSETFKNLLLPEIMNDYKLHETFEYNGEIVSCPIVAHCGETDAEANKFIMNRWEKVTSNKFTIRSFKGGHFFPYKYEWYLQEIEKEILLRSDIMNNILYWSPTFFWSIQNNNLHIGNFNYGSSFKDLFPEFYFLTQNGISQDELIEKTGHQGIPKYKAFIRDLVKKKVLIYSPLEIQKLVSIQNKIIDAKMYRDELNYNSDLLNKYKKEKLNRNPISEEIVFEEIDVPEVAFSSIIENRKTIRKYSMKNIPKNVFLEIISCLRKRNEDSNYYYASAGGLYPIDIYVYVKESRISEIAGGLYYYSPCENKLKRIKTGEVLNSESQFFLNKEIFNGSAFTIFFIFDSNVTAPKYGGMSYLYACIDTGLIVSLVSYIASTYNIGSCSIGDMDYEKIKKIFPMSDTMSFIHSMEFGYADEEDI
ncbi:MAG: SagB family peptide dehydrogenase [Anaerococcus vaginalis]|uniref:thioesterase domain-containing protein n=1 Tax=Anaerococcus vaginalis TaxID=33037 RepID=UPI00291315BC|nr:thioesterase domain-containing protein [Anaerococcus vaginalis]MDU5087077.1 SagB family peptide dehydrogenase [Anaerococcus vaginalis]